MKIFISRYLFPTIVLIFSLLILAVALNPSKPQTPYFLLSGIALFVCAITMILLSAEIIKPKIIPFLTIGFVAFSAAFIYWNYKTISNETQYAREFEIRYQKVKDRLVVIRAAQIAYKDAHKGYAPSFDSLVDFLKNGTLTIVKMEGNMDDSLAVALGKVTRKEVQIPVIGSYAFQYENYPVDSLPFIPFGNGTTFSIETSTIIPNGDSAMVQPTFLVQANFKDFLSDIGEKYNKTVKDSLIRLGSLSEPTTNGNWR